MKENILVTVKTYPHPSESYQELVCTAGVREDGSFIRLYPVDYRYRPRHQQYEKYQWIEVDVTKNTGDPRPESYRPNLDTVRILSEPISTADNWAERKRLVLARSPQTMCSLHKAFEKDKTSLGIIKPHRISEVHVKPVEREWAKKHEEALFQYSLFDQQKKLLTKIPYRFAYKFTCGDDCTGHNMSITDWELGALYLREVKRLGNEIDAVESVRKKYFDDLCGPEKDTHFYVGNTYTVYNSWIVLGVFYPKLPKQPIANTQPSFNWEDT
jgi:hypothetical protein